MANTKEPSIKWSKDQNTRPNTGLNFYEALIVHFGGMNNAADALGCSYQALNNWRFRGGVPLAAVKKIEELTKGKVNREMI
jgi:hypothetical protein